MKFDKELSVLKKNNYFTKIANSFISFDLDAWPRNPTAFSNLKIDCMGQLV